MLKTLGLCLGSRKNRTRVDKSKVKYISSTDDYVVELESSDDQTDPDTAAYDCAQRTGMPSYGDDEPLLLTEIDPEDDFNLLEESPDGGRTYYSGGRDATGHRETVRWEGVGLIRTPRSKTRSRHVRSESMKELGAILPLLDVENRCDSVTEGCKGSPGPPRKTKRQMSTPACYRELRALKSWNQPHDVSKQNRQWHTARQLELDELHHLWIDYQETSKRGKKGATRTWSKTKSSSDMYCERRGCPGQPFSDVALQNRQVHSALGSVSSSGKQNRLSEAPVARTLFPDDISSSLRRTNSEGSTDAKPTSPTPDFLLEEALAVASRFSDDRPERHRRTMSVGTTSMGTYNINSAGQPSLPQPRTSSKNLSARSQKRRSSSRSSGRLGSGVGSVTPRDPKSGFVKTPNMNAQQRDPPHSSRPPKSLSDLPQTLKSSVKAKTPAATPLRTASKNKIPKLDSSESRTPRGPQRVPVKRGAAKASTVPSPGFTMPRGASAGRDAGSVSKGPSLTPRKVGGSQKRPETGVPRKGLQSKAAPSPRPGFGPVVRVPMDRSVGATPRKGYTPRDVDSHAAPKTATRLSFGAPQRLAPMTVGSKTPRRKVVVAPPRVSSASRVK